MIDPAICNVAIDANALDRPKGDPTRAALVARLLALRDARRLTLIVPHGVLAEIQRPGTPADVRAAASAGIYTIRTGLTEDERRRRQVIERALQGNARQGRHAADAEHLAEAAKYGGYFITHDERILKRSHGLSDVLGPALQVVTLAEFLRIYDAFHSGQEGQPP
jgi:hypothetical protein